MKKIVLLVAVAIACVESDRVYESECPAVTPMSDFDMQRFLGVWYQIQPENGPEDDQNQPDPPSCEFYNITNSKRRDSYNVNEMIEIYTRFEGDVPLQYESISKGHLNVIDGNVPAVLQQRPTLGANIIESNFTVVSTDYDSYAIISNCLKGMNAENGNVEFSQHTTLWSRDRQLEENFVEKLYDSIGVIDFDPYDLNTIEGTGCIDGGKRLARVDLDNGEIVPV